MNWPELEKIRNQTLNGKMTAKEASDQISQIWYLIKFHVYKKDHYLRFPSLEHPDYDEEHKALLDLCTDVYKVMHTEERGSFLIGWIDTMPTDMKPLEIYKKEHKEKFI